MWNEKRGKEESGSLHKSRNFKVKYNCAHLVTDHERTLLTLLWGRAVLKKEALC